MLRCFSQLKNIQHFVDLGRHISSKQRLAKYLKDDIIKESPDFGHIDEYEALLRNPHELDVYALSKSMKQCRSEKAKDICRLYTMSALLQRTYDALSGPDSLRVIR